jgi:transcriptional regulatory protein LevR
MKTQTIQKELTSTTSLEWDARQRKIVILSFVVTGLGTALILGLGTLLGN